MDKNIRHLFWFYFLLGIILIGYLLKINFVDKEEYITSSYNPRMKIYDEEVQRGDILDRNDTLLVQSKKTEVGYVRNYLYSEAFAHIIGYMQNGGYGIEKQYNYELQDLSKEAFQHLEGYISDYTPKANSLKLTLDADLQKYSYERLGSKKGGIVAIEPDTGKILAMVSNPAFNPNTLSENLDTLRTDDNSPLLNRATQGLYPPGSIFKTIVQVSQLENNVPLELDCTGSVTFSGHRINCFDGKKHNLVDSKRALALSCNTYFATLGNLIGSKNLIKTSEDFMFNKELKYPLEYKKSQFVLDENANESDIGVTSIGQGETLVSPLHMALVTSAFANNGVMMKPYVVDSILDYNHNEVKKFYPQKLTNVTSPENSVIISGYMKGVVENGTATDAVISSSAIAGKTGTAENEGEDHSWFIAFAPYENPEIAVAVVLENIGSRARAVPIARDIIKFYLGN